MSKKYAIRITEETHALVRVLSHFSEQAIQVKEGQTYFLFTVDSPTTTTDHDVVHADNFEMYDGDDSDRIVLQ